MFLENLNINGLKKQVYIIMMCVAPRIIEVLSTLYIARVGDLNHEACHN